MLRQLLHRHRTRLIVTTILSGASGGICVGLLASINDLAASGLSGRDLGPIVSGLVLLAAFIGVGAVAQIQLAKLGADLVADLRQHLSRCFLMLDYERMAQRKHLVFGALIADIGRMGPLVLLAPQLAYNALLVVLYGVYLIRLSAPLFAVLIAFHGLTLILGAAMERRTRARFDALREGDEKVFEHFRTLSEGKKELSLSQHRARHFTETLLHPSITSARDMMYGVHLGWGLADSVATALSYGAVFGIIVIGHAVLRVPAEIVVQVVISALFLAVSINFLVQAVPQVASGLASLRHLQGIGLDLDVQTAVPFSSVSDSAGDTPEWQRLRANGLFYRYPEEAPGELRRGVGPIDLELSRGEMVFITGGNGSGKSTLLLLLCALLRPSEGTLELDGQSVWDEPSRYRSLFGTIFGDFFLFAHVLDGQGELMPDVQIDRLLRHLRLYPHVSAREGELSKLNVSSGQRKRLALLQCYAQDRDIIVLDEWAADQDPHFREHFYRELLPELKRQGKTLLVISHDDRYFHIADRVLTLEDGLIRTDTSAPSAAHRPGTDLSCATSHESA